MGCCDSVSFISYGVAKTRNVIGVNFLRTEVETAFVCARIALQATDAEKKIRNRQHALRGYEALLHFVNRFGLTTDEQDANPRLHSLTPKTAQTSIYTAS